MCGRYTLTEDLEDFEARFGFAGNNLALVPRYNIAPTQEVLAVVQGEEER